MSLEQRRLGTDQLDLYQVHRPSPDTDLEETLGALTAGGWLSGRWRKDSASTPSSAAFVIKGLACRP